MGSKTQLDLHHKILSVSRIRSKGENLANHPIIIMCANVKNDIISRYISLRCLRTKLSLKDLYLSELNELVYINEYLTNETKQLFKLMRKARKLQPQFLPFVFTRNGRVAIKIKGDSKYKIL